MRSLTTKCRKCNIELGEEDPKQNGMCIDCFADDWGELVEEYPMASPRILLPKQNDEMR